MRDLVQEYLEFVDDVVDELDSREEINYIHTILETAAAPTGSCAYSRRLGI